MRKTFPLLVVLIFSIPTDSNPSFHNWFRLNCVTLSESGNIMACGMNDSSIKVFIFDKSAHDVITTEDIILKQEEEKRS